MSEYDSTYGYFDPSYCSYYEEHVIPRLEVEDLIGFVIFTYKNKWIRKDVAIAYRHKGNYYTSKWLIDDQYLHKSGMAEEAWHKKDHGICAAEKTFSSFEESNKDNMFRIFGKKIKLCTLGDNYYCPITKQRWGEETDIDTPWSYHKCVGGRGARMIFKHDYMTLKEHYDKNIHTPLFRMKKYSLSFAEKNRSYHFPKKEDAMRFALMGSTVCECCAIRGGFWGKTRVPTDKKIAQMYYSAFFGYSRHMFAHEPGLRQRFKRQAEAYFERRGIDPRKYRYSTVKSIARHLAKKAKKLKKITAKEVDFFKMIHGASLLKNLNDRKVAI